MSNLEKREEKRDNDQDDRYNKAFCWYRQYVFNKKAVWIVRESNGELSQSVDDKVVPTTKSKPDPCALLFPPSLFTSNQASEQASAHIVACHHAAHLVATKSHIYKYAACEL